ncbi:formate dehydrogenase accessory sulfurtransferase FdhD [Limobrevibacterium gyesilva]|uniref:Formate dehydrogenase accessory sulfurtransferase FdhD n=1 Tax=Limobrevibacterium gyesilva TaxID=2991712 RepID=A0AA41YKH7_9PROT|nr:formate dehydrogenase accessory sulfurtransferase FdhD [Limobrevibacterium gyesilva]MCW3474026.1 formate dehydrogenase accessory sulfurtransferase FdhD [Limobrevibacterium gyesilva]
MDEFLVAPDPDDPALSREVVGIDHTGATVATRVPVERPLTLFLNSQEIVTMMTIGDRPDCLAVGYLLNQNMLSRDDAIDAVEFDAELDVVVVRTPRRTNYEEKLKRRTLTSGCAQGTAFGNMLERFEGVRLDEDAQLRTSWLYALSRKINTQPSLYLAAGAIHGCVLCEADRPLVYMEDVGRHNAIDKIAGWMHLNGVGPADKLFYTTGRLTSEMVIKCVQMEIPILVSRSGFTAWGVELAQQAGLTLIGRAKGKRFICVSGAGRLRFDADPAEHVAEGASRKGSRDDDG